MALLDDNLARIDAEEAPAYLESSERQGFHRLGEFKRPDEQLTISTMWREAKAP